MDQFFWFVLQVLDTITLGWLSRWGARHGRSPDPAEVWQEEERRRDRERLASEALVGRTGIVVTPLRPAGRVDVNRRVYEATSESGFIDAGAQVEVLGRSSFALVVRERSA
jgi:membrane-bound serine protease (ClpP class)